MNELFESLFEPFPNEVKQTKTQGGQSITFVSWIHYVIRAWNTFPEGYSKDVRVTEVGGQLIVTVRITDRKSGCYQEALGAAPAEKKSWGGAMAEAESQAFRRAMANWGLGLEMYLDDDEWERVARTINSSAPVVQEAEEEAEVAAKDRPATDRQIEVMKVLGGQLDALAEEDEELKLFLNKQRAVLKKGMTAGRAGVVVAAFREKFAELGYDDPTKADNAS